MRRVVIITLCIGMTIIGLGLGALVSINRVTAQDVTPPCVISTTPSNSSVDVLMRTGLIIQFSEGMNESAVENAILVHPDMEIYDFFWSGSSFVVFDFVSELLPFTEYTITINESATDIAGNPLEESYSWSFTTGGLSFSYDYWADMDDDGLLDGWEYEYFGDLSETGHGDFDNDGNTNFREFRDGTDPTNPESKTPARFILIEYLWAIVLVAVLFIVTPILYFVKR